MYNNPFIYKRSLIPGVDDLVSIERKPLLEKAMSSLHFGQWLNVCCAKKSGKTSFLLKLIEVCERRYPQYHFFMMTPEHLQKVAQRELPEVVFERIRETTQKNPKTKNFFSGLNEKFDSLESGFSFLNKNLKEEQRFIVVIDALECATKKVQQTILQNLTNFCTAQATQTILANVQFIIAGSLTAANLRLESGTSFAEHSTKTFLEDFKFDDVDKMLMKACSYYTIHLDEGFTHLLYEWTGGTGYLIQKICYKLLETAYLRSKKPVFSTTSGDEAIRNILREGETNVEMIIQEIEKDTKLVEALLRVMRNGAMQASKFDPALHTLVSLGALSLRNERFRLRNPMYEKMFQDYFTSEHLANLFYARKKYYRAKELFSEAISQEIDAKNALDSLLTTIKAIHESTNRSDSDFINYILQLLMQTVEGVKISSFFLVDHDENRLEITDAIGMSAKDLSRINLKIGEGVAGSVAQTGRTRVNRDVTDEVECPDFVQRGLAEKLNIGAMISLPVFAAEKVVGVINLCLSKPREFTYSETKMLEILATQVSEVLQRQPLTHTIARYETFLDVFESAIASIDSHIDAEITLGKILESAYQITGCEKIYAVWKDNVTNSWKFKFPNWKMAQDSQTSQIIGKNNKSSAMFSQGKIYMTPDLENDNHYFDIWHSLHAEQTFRITIEGDTIGCLVVDNNQSKQFSALQQKLLSMLTSLAGIALKKDRLFGLADKKTQQFITLKAIGEVVGNTKSVDELLKLIAKECLIVVDRPNKSAKILLWDRERDKLIAKASRGDEFGKMALGASLSVQDRSIITWVLRNREPRYAANVKEDPEYRQKNKVVRSEIAVPLIFHDEILGVVDVQSTQLNDFSLQDQDSLIAVANSAAIAIKIAELTGTRLRELEALYRIGTKISSTLHTNDVMRAVCREGLTAIVSKNRTLTVHVLHAEDKRLITSLTMENLKKFNRPKRMRYRENSVLQWIAKKKNHLLIPYAKSEPLYKSVTQNVKSAMFVPITFDDRLIGVFQVESRVEDDFGESELKLMSGLANQAGAALENARLSQDLTKTQMQLSHALETVAIEEALASLTHDIKNISTLIAEETQWLKKCQRKNQPKLNKDINSAIKNIHSYIQRVDEMTNNLKRSKDKQILDLKRINLGLLVDDAIELVAFSAMRRKIEIVRNDTLFDLHVLVDTGRIVRAFFNIITNAIDAMRDGGTLKITARKNRSVVEIDFADCGAGIPPEILNKVVNPLFSTKNEGYGLGLALTKRIVETDHQGKLILISEEGKGTTVRIKLPIGEISSKIGHKKKRSSRPHQTKPVVVEHSNSFTDTKRRVLVVNDETDMLKKIIRKLRNAGFRVTGTKYGREAVHFCNQESFDAILMDYHLKKDKGFVCTAFDFIPQIRNNMPSAPIILTSASLHAKPANASMFDYFLEINASFWDDVLPVINTCLDTEKQCIRVKLPQHKNLDR